MVLYVDLSRAIWKSSGTPQHSTASKIGLSFLNSNYLKLAQSSIFQYLHIFNGFQNLCFDKITPRTDAVITYRTKNNQFFRRSTIRFRILLIQFSIEFNLQPLLQAWQLSEKNTWKTRIATEYREASQGHKDPFKYLRWSRWWSFFSENSNLDLWKGHKCALAWVQNGLRVISLILLACYDISLVDRSDKQWCKLWLLHCNYYIYPRLPLAETYIIPDIATTISTVSFLFRSSFFHSWKNKVKYSVIDKKRTQCFHELKTQQKV